MKRRISTISVVVRDYDEAIEFYTQQMGFVLVEDTPLTEGKRWVVVAPSTGSSPGLLLARAATSDQTAHVGNQTGGRVFLFLETDDFARDHAAMKKNGIEFLEEPREESYATVAQFRDPYGNKWDLLQRRP